MQKMRPLAPLPQLVAQDSFPEQPCVSHDDSAGLVAMDNYHYAGSALQRRATGLPAAQGGAPAAGVPPARTVRTGLPDRLKYGIENLSGIALDGLNVHYNSSLPALVQAHAYAAGSEIHLAPGQQKHLPHEAWHVVQQKQGRVKPTLQMKQGAPVNDDAELEREADTMGAKAVQAGSRSLHGVKPSTSQSMAVQRMPLAQADGMSVIQRKLTLKGEEADKDLALEQLNSLAGSAAITLADAGAGTWEASIGASATSGGTLLKNLINDEQQFFFDFSSAVPPQYDPAKHTVFMNVRGESTAVLPAKGLPEGDYTREGNQDIYLGHEFNHALRHLKGHAKDRYKDIDGAPVSDQWVRIDSISGEHTLSYYMQLEEAENIGLKPTLDTGSGAWVGTSENAFLAQQGKPVRLGYFKQDSQENKLNRLDYLKSLTITTGIRYAEFLRKTASLAGGAAIDAPLQSAVALVAAKKAEIEDCKRKAEAAEKHKTDWLGHKNENLLPRKEAAEISRDAAAEEFGNFDEAEQWSAWVAQNLALAGGEDSGYDADWNKIDDPEDGSAEYDSAWYQQVQLINARRLGLEGASARAATRFGSYSTLADKTSGEGLDDSTETGKLHLAIIKEIGEEVDAAESQLIPLVDSVLDLMTTQLNGLQAENLDKAADITILKNLVTTWRPVASYNSNG